MVDVLGKLVPHCGSNDVVALVVVAVGPRKSFETRPSQEGAAQPERGRGPCRFHAPRKKSANSARVRGRSKSCRSTGKCITSSMNAVLGGSSCQVAGTN